jgi:hypothetical protein
MPFLPKTGRERTDSRPTERCPTMTPNLLLILPALAALACGWYASAWFYRRKLDALQEHVKAIRHTAAEHASQARRQIGLLQAELATRLPAPASHRARRAAEAAHSPPQVVTTRMRIPDHGFDATVIGSTGFQPTQVMED